MKSLRFSGLLMGSVVLALFRPMHRLPDRPALPTVTVPVGYDAVTLTPVTGQLRIAGAWLVTAGNRRFGGLSALAIDRGAFLALSDLGAAVRFDPPSTASPRARISDLGDGPGDPRHKTSRDAESLVRDPAGSGWWVGFEQQHSVWQYGGDFGRAAQSVALDRPDWWSNRGAEGLLTDGDALLVIAENGREMMRIDGEEIERLPLDAGMDVADAARAPDGSAWLLLRTKGLGGITQAIAPLVRTPDGYRVGAKWPLPKAPLDNYEGLAITARPDGGWRFWLVSDDGHRILARTLLVALDLPAPPQKQTPDVKRRASGLPR